MRCAPLLLALLVSTPVLAGDFLHIRVENKAEGGELVRVNIPLSLIETLLPAIEHEDGEDGNVSIKDGKVSVQLDKDELKSIDFVAIFKALREAPQGNYVTIKNDKDNVRVRKEGNLLLVDVDNSSKDGDGPERVQVRMPLDVFEAVFKDARSNVDAQGRTEIDMLALIKALGRTRGADLITVVSDRENVRIWVDDKMED